MEQCFELTVQYHGNDKHLPAKLVTMGYTYKIFIDVDGTEVVFEPDEERRFRAIIDSAHQRVMPATGYIIAITEALENLLKE